jgi:outer membrane lipoprotein-sorting protein
MDILTSLFKRPLRAALAGALAAAAIPTALTLPVATANAQANTGQSDIDKAVRALRAITTLRADFIQTDRSGTSLKGELTMKQPGRIKFEYSDDVNMLVVSDGRSLTLVDYDVRQVERWPIRNSPLGALLDPERDVKKYGTLVPTGNADVLSIEVKDPDRPEFGKITLIMVKDGSAPGGYELVSWVALDSQNRRTTVRLSNQLYGIAVPNSTFSFRDPRVTTRRPR